VLRSRGYHDADVTWKIDSSRRPARVAVQVSRGQLYRFTRFSITGLPEDVADLTTEEGLASLGVTIGAAARAETVLNAEAGLLVVLARRGYPFAMLRPRLARIDRGANAMTVRLRVDAGPATHFGEVSVEGLERVEEEFVRGRLKWSRGERFSSGAVEDTRRSLFEAGVFSAVSITWGTRVDVGPDGLAPIRIVVAESKRRTVGAGVKWSSTEGFGGRAFWEHRNLRGGAERLRLEVEASELLSTGGAFYREPDWLALGQFLLLQASIDADYTPAYDRQALVVSGGIERSFTPRLLATAGLSLEQSLVDGKADPGKSQFTLVGVPIGLRYDASDDLLDPTRGMRTTLGMTPYLGVLGDTVEMFVVRVGQSVYVPLVESRRLVWASRATLGSIVGAERGEIPADKRFYAGGGDSVRGYEYQSVGPLDRDNDPFGGRSLVQAGSELRWKVTETIGLVPFLEGAGVYEPSWPDFDGGMQWAGGLGLRYFTVAGPLRLDVAFPINPRRVDDLFEIYISLGQAF